VEVKPKTAGREKARKEVKGKRRNQNMFLVKQHKGKNYDAVMSRKRG
jgi:hypothetical protein